MAISIEKLPIPPLELGEGPHWDSASQTLFLVDILAGYIHKFHPASKKHSSAYIGPNPVSFIIPVEGETNKFVVSSNCELKILTWDEKSEKPIIEALGRMEDENSPNRINDGKCDPIGRLWAGTMGPLDVKEKKGSLYSFGAGKGNQKHFSNIGISNGLAWDVGVKKFYYIDTSKFKVFGYDYDAKEGTIANESVICDFKEKGINGMPDGMTIDNEGKLWVACFDGGKVLRIDPTNGNVLNKVELPSFQVTSVAFGGKNLDELYVTSANLNQTTETMKNYPDAGYTFKVTGLGVKGLPMNNFRK